MPHPDEGLIHAWLDGELDGADAARVAALVTNDPAWAAAAAEARGLIAASSRITGALDRVPRKVIPRARAAPRATRWWMVRAAALLVVVAGMVTVARRAPPDLGESTVATPAPEALKPPVPQTRSAQAATDAASTNKPIKPTATPPAKPVAAAAATSHKTLAATVPAPPTEAQTAPAKTPGARAEAPAALLQKERTTRVPLSLSELTVTSARAAAKGAAGTLNAPVAGTAATLRGSIAGAPAPRCFKWREPTDSAASILRISPIALADSLRLGVWFEHGDSLLGASRRLLALALPCPQM